MTDEQTKSSPTLARKFADRWNTGKGDGLIQLARRIDRTVKIVAYTNPSQIEYTFSDGSVARSQGRGRNLIVWLGGS